jgi:hypothetical protein
MENGPMGLRLDYFLKPTQATGIKRVNPPGIPATFRPVFLPVFPTASPSFFPRAFRTAFQPGFLSAFLKNLRQIVPAAALSALVFSGCIQSPESGTEKEPAPMMFRIAHPIPGFDEVADSALLVISHPDMDSIYQPLHITDSTLEAEISGIIKGDLRHFEVMVFDHTKTLAYYGDGFTDEVPTPQTTMNISLGRVGKVKVEAEFQREID